jgi:hypothetical protein
MDADEKSNILESVAGQTAPIPGMSVRTVLKGAVGLTKAALQVGRASEVVIRQRRAICAACPQATSGSSRMSRCQICTCFIHPKSATASERCPAEKRL